MTENYAENEAEPHIYLIFNILKTTLQKDGNRWCALYGNDLQSGIAGFGDSPHEAILNWVKEMKKEEQRQGELR